MFKKLKKISIKIKKTSLLPKLRKIVHCENRESNKFVISVYRKTTFTNVFK